MASERTHKPSGRVMRPKMEVDIVTLFPDFFTSPLEQSILKRARHEGKIQVRVHDLRKWTHDKHRTVDDKPFGGGPGMVMKPEPFSECLEELKKSGKRGKPWVVLLEPQGEPLKQKVAAKLALKKRLILLSGHYEGVDYRVREHLVDQEISVGDFITMGGEAPALCLLEAVTRLIPGVLGNKASLDHESFHVAGLEYPQYTRPRNFRGWQVPEVLVSGDHREVKKWRDEKARDITRKKRPDLARESNGLQRQ